MTKQSTGSMADTACVGWTTHVRPTKVEPMFVLQSSLSRRLPLHGMPVWCDGWGMVRKLQSS